MSRLSFPSQLAFYIPLEISKLHAAPNMQLASTLSARCYTRGGYATRAQRTPPALRASHVFRVPQLTCIRSACWQATDFSGRRTQRRSFRNVCAKAQQKVKTCPPRWLRLDRVAGAVICAALQVLVASSFLCRDFYGFACVS